MDEGASQLHCLKASLPDPRLHFAIISAHSYLPIALDFPFWQLSIDGHLADDRRPSSFHFTLLSAGFQSLGFGFGFGFGFGAAAIVVITIKKHFANPLTTCSLMIIAKKKQGRKYKRETINDERWPLTCPPRRVHHRGWARGWVDNGPAWKSMLLGNNRPAEKLQKKKLKKKRDC